MQRRSRRNAPSAPPPIAVATACRFIDVDDRDFRTRRCKRLRRGRADRPGAAGDSRDLAGEQQFLRRAGPILRILKDYNASRPTLRALR
jgi:hypothetical protein